MRRADVIDRLNTGDTGGAVTILRRLLDLHPEDADLLGLLGIALEDSSDPAGAEAALRSAVEQPAETAIRLRNLANLASLLFDSGQRKDAASLMQQAQLRWEEERAPEANELTCLARLAEVMQHLGLHDETAALLSPLPDLTAPDWPILRPLVSALAHNGETGQALRLMEAHQPGDAVAHEREALWAHLCWAEGRPRESADARRRYLASAPPVLLPARERQTLTVGVIEKPPSCQKLGMPWPRAYFTENYPSSMPRMLSDRYRMAAIFLHAGNDAVKQFNGWQPDVIINNFTNAEVLQTANNLAEARAFCDQFDAPLINPPDAAIHCTRQKNPLNLAGIDDLVLPSVRRFRCDLARLDDLVAEIEAGTPYPMIVRTVYEQETRNMTLVRRRTELEDAIRTLEKAQFYVIDYLGQGRDHGYFRRMRSLFIGEQPILIWVDYSPKWTVRSRRYIDLQTYRDHPDLLDKANAIIRNPREELGEKAISALEAVGQTIPLDIFGMDFDVDEDGKVVFFETNATMLMKVPVPEAFAYPPEATERLTVALDRLLHQFADRKG
jgi:tetratricopeptide (TPR) repeat protein